MRDQLIKCLQNQNCKLIQKQLQKKNAKHWLNLKVWSNHSVETTLEFKSRLNLLSAIPRLKCLRGAVVYDDSFNKATTPNLGTFRLKKITFGEIFSSFRLCVQVSSNDEQV